MTIAHQPQRESYFVYKNNSHCLSYFILSFLCSFSLMQLFFASDFICATVLPSVLALFTSWTLPVSFWCFCTHFFLWYIFSFLSPSFRRPSHFCLCYLHSQMILCLFAHSNESTAALAALCFAFYFCFPSLDNWYQDFSILHQ